MESDKTEAQVGCLEQAGHSDITVVTSLSALKPHRNGARAIVRRERRMDETGTMTARKIGQGFL
jgi:hypothetical protein